ncbi:MAG: serine protease [Rhodoferax sp.]|uniref:S1 family peptidase n=1 Tax=Rhodoferax sp. TaxID=50421 RepID=UPI003265260C
MDKIYIQWICLLGVFFAPFHLARADLVDTIAKVKPSIIIVGYYKNTNSPRFTLRGSGFVAVGGNLGITNSHVLFSPSEDGTGSDLVVQVRGPKGEWQMRQASVLEQDRVHDLALLRFTGEPVPFLALRDSNTVREGQSVALMGFPIGGALGFSPVTHRAMVSSITPIVLPAATGQLLTEKSIRSIRDGSFDIFQLDGTAYPGNSGGPLFDAESGEVVGIVNMVFVKSTKESAISQPSGITYAIPSNFIQQLVQRQKAN